MRSDGRWRFGSFELDAARGILRRDGVEVDVAAKPLALLQHLLRRRGAIVSRRELLDAVWPGVTVSDAAFQSALRDLRRALGDPAAEGRILATLRGKGLRLVPPAERVPESPEPDPATATAEGALGPWHRAVLHLERALQAADLVRESRGLRGEDPARAAFRERGELLVLLAQARWSLGSTAEARAAFREAADTARRLGDAEILARAALGFAGRTDAAPGVNREAAALLEEALTALGTSRPSLRAEVQARLGTELYHDTDPARADALTERAVREAERCGDDAVLAYALTARHFARQRPEVDPAERTRLADRAIALIGEGAPSDVLALALQERLLDALERGDGATWEATYRRYAVAVDELGQPFFAWLLCVFRGVRALLAGDPDEAERLASEALARGRRLATPNAEAAFAGQLFAVRDHQGRLGELMPLLRARAFDPSERPIFRAALATVASSTEDRDAAEKALREVFLHDLDDFPRDQSWLGLLGLLAPPVARSGHAARARRLLDLFGPYAGRCIVVGHGAAVLGAVSHHLGVLHAALGERRAALRRLEAAEREHRSLGSPLWVGRSREALEALR